MSEIGRGVLSVWAWWNQRTNVLFLVFHCCTCSLAALVGIRGFHFAGNSWLSKNHPASHDGRRWNWTDPKLMSERGNYMLWCNLLILEFIPLSFYESVSIMSLRRQINIKEKMKIEDLCFASERTVPKFRALGFLNNPLYLNWLRFEKSPL